MRYHDPIGRKNAFRDVLPEIHSFKTKAYFQSSKYDEALHFIVISIDMAEKENNNEQLVSSLLTQGAILAQLGRKREALPPFSRAYELLSNKTDSNSMESKIRVAINLGNVLKNMRNFKRAIEVFQEGIEIAQQRGESSMLAILYSNLSLVYAEVNDFGAQRKMLWQAYHIMPENNPKRASILMSMASTFKHE